MAQSSKLMRPDDVGLGGFDSHTLPPAGLVRRGAVLMLCAAAAASAQKPDSVGFKASSADTVPQASQRVLKPFALPPISPRRAFLYSALVPGMGQAALD